MNSSKKWYISLEERSTHFKMSIYLDGRVYGNHYNEKLCILKPEAINKIKSIITPNLALLRRERYLVDKKGQFIIRINDTSKKHPNCIKVINPDYDKIFDIIKDTENHLKTY